MNGGAGAPASCGVRVAVDVGSVRVGLAASDPAGVLAFPLETVPAGAGCASRVAAVVQERAAVEVVVGLPVTLAGREGSAAEGARRFAAVLAPLIAPVPIVMADERLTTVAAQRSLRAAGVRGRAVRSVVDQAAAVALLQGVLDSGRSR